MENRSKVDSKGRLLIPLNLRKKLDISPGSDVVMIPENDGRQARIIPLSNDRMAKCRIEITNSPGGLAGIMEMLEMLNVGVVLSESKYLMEDDKSEWSFILDLTKSKGDTKVLEDRLSVFDEVKSVNVSYCEIKDE